MPRYCLTVTDETETARFASCLAMRLQAGDLLCLSGDLGAGKTTFTRHLVKAFGSPAPVSSPTFTLIHEYHGGRLSVFHADMYRMSSAADLEATGLGDYLLRGDGVTIIEWWERVAPALPQERLTITIVDAGDDCRDVSLETSGPRWDKARLSEVATPC